ncbi:hypothetical protein M9H77_03554 [Catharanthus roseus]|uniref:Uncharacterized protein n=1 Tax=Catharanthus roseus TaxID=4058 RepID=A0ACC0CBK7_CATRO|nr:hypothetical protein M9H77_03554 [Catharanthus roseus]
MVNHVKDVENGMSGTIPTKSSKASTAANDMKITNYNELIDLNIEENLEDQADPSNGRNFPTSNVFFPDVCKIQLKLREWENSQHDFLKVMAGPMKQKFKKYWKESCLILGFVVVLDPRFKMNLVEFCYDTIYGSDVYRYVERIKNAFHDLYIEYGRQVSYVSNNPYPIFGGGTSEDDYSAFDEWYKTNKSTTIQRDLLSASSPTTANCRSPNLQEMVSKKKRKDQEKRTYLKR